MDDFEWSLFTQLNVTYDEVPYRGVVLEDASGCQYQNLKYYPHTKTIWYDMKDPSQPKPVGWDRIMVA